MSRVTVSPGYEPFTGNYAGLHKRLVEAIALRDDLPINGEFRPDFFRQQAIDRANKTIDLFERKGEAPAGEVGTILEQMLQNFTAWQTFQKDRAATVAAMNQKRDESLDRTIPPSEIRIFDHGTGRDVIISLPPRSVRFAEAWPQEEMAG